MTQTYPYQPDYAVAPGTTLRDTLEAKGMSQADLALRTGISEKTISQIINGIAAITYETSEKLELVLGVPASFWNTRERSYREAIIRAEEINRLDADSHWLKEIPLSVLIDRGHIHDDTDKRSLVRQALRFFGVSSVEAWRNTWEAPAAQYRGGSAQERRPGFVATWLRLGELQAESITTSPFDAGQFRSVIMQTRELNLSPMKDVVPKLTAMYAPVGVAVVLTKEIVGASVSGAVRWLNKEKAIIQLSLKYKTHDQFWFTFFHEVGHILLHGKRRVFVEYGLNNSTEEEREANAFARDTLIPPDYQQRLPYLRSRAQIKAFAQSIGVAPGIVVGRLHHDDPRTVSMFNDLKLKLKWGA